MQAFSFYPRNADEAVKTIWHRKLMVADITNDVRMGYPALTLTSVGLGVQVVADAGGSPSKIDANMALCRM